MIFAISKYSKASMKNLPNKSIDSQLYSDEEVQQGIQELFSNEKFVNGGDPIRFTNIASLGRGTDWQEEIFNTAAVFNHALSVRGGGEKYTYYLRYQQRTASSPGPKLPHACDWCFEWLEFGYQ